MSQQLGHDACASPEITNRNTADLAYVYKKGGTLMLQFAYIYTHTYIHSIELKLGRRLGAALINLYVGLS